MLKEIPCLFIYLFIYLSGTEIESGREGQCRREFLIYIQVLLFITLFLFSVSLHFH